MLLGILWFLSVLKVANSQVAHCTTANKNGTICTSRNDYCYERYNPGETGGGCSRDMDYGFQPTCGPKDTDIRNGECKKSEQGSRVSKRDLEDKLPGHDYHNVPQRAHGWMCCCDTENDCNKNMDPEGPWIDHYCTKCATQSKWNNKTKDYDDDIVMMPQCSVPSEPRYCYDLSVEPKEVLGNKILPEHNERNCEWQLMEKTRDVHYMHYKESQCDKIIKETGYPCGNTQVIMKTEHNDQTILEQRRAVICCCDTYKYGEGCNRYFSAYNVTICFKECFNITMPPTLPPPIHSTTPPGPITTHTGPTGSSPQPTGSSPPHPTGSSPRPTGSSPHPTGSSPPHPTTGSSAPTGEPSSSAVPPISTSGPIDCGGDYDYVNCKPKDEAVPGPSVLDKRKRKKREELSENDLK